MPRSSADRNAQRRHLDRRMKSAQQALSAPPPSSGWIRAVRESLGMTAKQLGRRASLATSTVQEIEQREVQRRVTLETLDRMASALGCRLVYAFVPTAGPSLEAIVDAQAHRVAEQVARGSVHTMVLEQQGVDVDEVRAQVEELAADIKRRMGSSLWETS